MHEIVIARAQMRPSPLTPPRLLGASWDHRTPVAALASLKRILSILWFGRRAGQALEAARRDLAAGPLPDAIAKRTKIAVAPRLHPLALRALSRAMNSAVTHARLDAPCLPRALALLGAVRPLGYAPELTLGVRRDADRVDAHAWLVLNNAPFLEDAGTPERYAVLEPASTVPTTPR